MSTCNACAAEATHIARIKLIGKSPEDCYLCNNHLALHQKKGELINYYPVGKPLAERRRRAA